MYYISKTKSSTKDTEQPFIMPGLESIGMNCVRTVNHAIKGQFYKKNYREVTFTWSLSYNSFLSP